MVWPQQFPDRIPQADLCLGEDISPHFLNDLPFLLDSQPYFWTPKSLRTSLLHLPCPVLFKFIGFHQMPVLLLNSHQYRPNWSSYSSLNTTIPEITLVNLSLTVTITNPWIPSIRQPTNHLPCSPPAYGQGQGQGQGHTCFQRQV